MKNGAELLRKGGMGGPCLNVRRLRRELFERDKTIAGLKARLAEKESVDVR